MMGPRYLLSLAGARSVRAIIVLAFLANMVVCSTVAGEHPRVIYVNGRDLQTVIDGAPAHSIVMCDQNQRITLSSTVMIRKPLTLRGLNARLADNVSKTPLLVILSNGVAIMDFELRGNNETVPQGARASLIEVRADNFRVENGVAVNSTRHGVLVSARQKKGSLSGGVVRGIVGRGNVRDVVSIEGDGSKGFFVKNVLVENIQCHNSRLRGAVEVCDGGQNITIRNIYAESSVYGVDVQDHGRQGQINSDITIQGLYVTDCDCAIRTANADFGHRNLTLRDVAGEKWRKGERRQPLRITHTANVVVQNVRIADSAIGPSVFVRNCDGASLRDVTIEDPRHDGPAVLIEDCNDTLIDGITLRGKTKTLTSGVLYRIVSDEAFSNLRILNVSAAGVKSSGILLENSSKNGTLTGYVITGNIARILDQIQGKHALIAANLSEKP